jgi:hypothetical protein
VYRRRVTIELMTGAFYTLGSVNSVERKFYAIIFASISIVALAFGLKSTNSPAYNLFLHTHQNTSKRFLSTYRGKAAVAERAEAERAKAIMMV